MSWSLTDDEVGLLLAYVAVNGLPKAIDPKVKAMVAKIQAYSTVTPKGDGTYDVEFHGLRLING